MLIEAGCDIHLPKTFQATSTAALQPLLAGVQGIYAGVDISAEVLRKEAAELQIISVGAWVTASMSLPPRVGYRDHLHARPAG